ncbi:hypothetical protein ACNKHV_05725 [Shigella flexneri]
MPVQNETSAAGSGVVVREYLSQYPRARHFDVARIVIDSAVRLA